jgi:hypothetical protein
MNNLDVFINIFLTTGKTYNNFYLGNIALDVSQVSSSLNNLDVDGMVSASGKVFIYTNLQENNYNVSKIDNLYDTNISDFS